MHTLRHWLGSRTRSPGDPRHIFTPLFLLTAIIFVTGGHVRRFGGTGGRQLERAPTSCSIPAHPIQSLRLLSSVANPGSGRLVVDSATGRTFVTGVQTAVLDSRTGLLRQRLPIDGTDITLDPRTGRVVELDPGSGQSVHLLDPHDGSVVRVAPSSRSPMSIAVDGVTRRIFVSDVQGLVSVLDADTLRRVATMPLVPGGFAIDESVGRVFITGDRSEDIYGLDATTGRIVLSRVSGVRLGTGPFSSPVVDQLTHHVFVTAVPSNNATVVATIDDRTGFVVNTVPFYAGALLVEARQGILVAGGERRVALLDTRSGALLRTVAVPGVVAGMAVDDASGRLFVGTAGPQDSNGHYTGPGHLTVLSACTGAVLASVPVGHLPATVGLDSRLGRVVISGGDDSVVRILAIT